MQDGGVLRGKLKQLPGLRSTYYLAIVLRQMVEDQWKSPASFDHVFAASEDPWESHSDREKLRFATTLDVLAASGREKFPTAVELGCAEGIFTAMLAPMCEKLDALDFSEVALSRARRRLEGSSNVAFRKWDMRSEPLASTWDLVVAMGVLTSLYRPRDVRTVSAGVVNAVKPGGFLLFSDVRQSVVFESAWWGPLMLRGGDQIRRHLTSLPQLELVRSADTESHVFALYRRRQAA
jgi:2-polyprenyl-3-methyl-5-hydroxy-6-metoxy-1,4-benzoquinol methylase